MIGGGQPLLPEILSQSDRVGGAKSPISDLFSLAARLWTSIAPMDMCAFHKRSKLYCGLYCVYDVVVKSSRSLSHPLMSFLFIMLTIVCMVCYKPALCRSSNAL